MRAGLSETHFPFVARLSTEGRRQLGALAPTRAASGALLLRRGDAASGAYLVVAGSLRVYYISAEGREATLYHVEPGGTCVLALAATLGGAPYPAWVEAGATGGEFVRVPDAAFHRLLDAEPGFRQFVFAALAERIHELMFTLEEAATARIEQRVARYLLRRQGRDGVVRVSQVALAAELGTAREVVFRALRTLAARKLIRTGRMHILVLDGEGLRRAVSPRA